MTIDAPELPPIPDGLTFSTPATDQKGMFRSAFGDPKPANFDQLMEAGQELELYFDEADVMVYADCGDPAPFNGWTAEIAAYTEDDERIELHTAGFESRELLVAALTKAGVSPRNIEDDQG